VESAWNFIKNCVDELETRDLAYRYIAICSCEWIESLSALVYLSDHLLMISCC
jgi:hypothetical protein